MRYAMMRSMDVSNGSGVGVSLFVQGCHFHCKGCFNQETWDFSGGKEWTPEAESHFLELANRPYISRISILGGEPLADENVSDIRMLIEKIHAQLPDKKIWLYTGYTVDSMFGNPLDCKCTNVDRILAVRSVDVVVDGQFQLDKQDLLNKEIVFAGSTNQRLIDVNKSKAYKKIMLLSD